LRLFLLCSLEGFSVGFFCVFDERFDVFGVPVE